MGSHETPSTVSGAFVNFVAALVKAAPRDGSDERYLYWVDNGEELTRVLCSALMSPEVQSAETPTASTTADLPTSFTVGGRMYDLLVFHREREDLVSGDTMIERARELEAESGEEDARFILEYQNEIPASLRGKIVMVFPKWRYPDGTQNVAYLCWLGDSWYQRWRWLDCQWIGDYRLVRRRTV